MIDHLVTLLENYPGRANRTRCFTHILNLVAKCIMRQFDEPKRKKVGERDDMEVDEPDNLAAALDDLEEELEDEENEGSGWEYDMRIDLTNEDIEELEESVKPV
jgi:hypothetical protein